MPDAQTPLLKFPPKDEMYQWAIRPRTERNSNALLPEQHLQISAPLLRAAGWINFQSFVRTYVMAQTIKSGSRSPTATQHQQTMGNIGSLLVQCSEAGPE